MNTAILSNGRLEFYDYLKDTTKITLGEFEPRIKLETDKVVLKEIVEEARHSIRIEFKTYATTPVILNLYNDFVKLENVVIVKNYLLVRHDKRISDKTWQKNVEEFKAKYEDGTRFEADLERALVAHNLRQAVEDGDRFKSNARRIHIEVKSDVLTSLYDQRSLLRKLIEDETNRVFEAKVNELIHSVKVDTDLSDIEKEYYLAELKERRAKGPETLRTIL